MMSSQEVTLHTNSADPRTAPIDLQLVPLGIDNPALRRLAHVLLLLFALFFGWLGFKGISVSTSIKRLVHHKNLQMSESGENLVSVAQVVSVSRKLYVEKDDEFSFSDAQAGDQIRAGDFVMSGPDSQTTLRLANGAELVLAPGTLAQFPKNNTRNSKTTVFRNESLELPLILAGGVSSKTLDIRKIRPIAKTIPLASSRLRSDVAKDLARTSELALLSEPKREAVPDLSSMPDLDPQPAVVPSGASAEFITPKYGEVILRPAFSKLPFAIPLQFKLERETTSNLEMDIYIQGALTQTIKPTGSAANLEKLFIQRPGDYDLKLRESDKVLAATKFTVAPQYRGLKWGAPTVLGSKALDNLSIKYTERNFELKLEWIAQNKEALSQKVTLNNGSVEKVYSIKGSDNFLKLKELTYLITPVQAKVIVEERSGFVSESEPLEIDFKFLPPRLATPRNLASVSLAQAKKGENKGILFTFGRTAFARRYEFELSDTLSFKQILAKSLTENNFLIVKTLSPGRYYWRVRSVSGSVKSPYGIPFQLVVTP